MPTNVSKETKPTYGLNSSMENSGNKNISQYLNSEPNLQVMPSPLECARACRRQTSFMFGTNDSDISRCNEKGCICSCGQDIIHDTECNRTAIHGFQVFQFLQEKRGENQNFYRFVKFFLSCNAPFFISTCYLYRFL